MKYMDFGLTVMTPVPLDEAVLTDGGTARDRPLAPDLDADALDPGALAENAPALEAVITLLTRPALARVYVYVCYWGPVTPPEVMEALELSKSTAYEYVDRLVERGLLTRDASTRPQTLTAEPVVLVEQSIPMVITPAVIHASALQAVDDDVAYFVDRHGLGTLIAALRGAGLHFAGETTQRAVASDIGVRDTEAMLIVYALVPALAVSRDHDPYFEYLFPDVHDRLDLPDIDERETTPSAPPPADE